MFFSSFFLKMLTFILIIFSCGWPKFKVQINIRCKTCMYKIGVFKRAKIIFNNGNPRNALMFFSFFIFPILHKFSLYKWNDLIDQYNWYIAQPYSLSLTYTEVLDEEDFLKRPFPDLSRSQNRGNGLDRHKHSKHKLVSVTLSQGSAADVSSPSPAPPCCCETSPQPASSRVWADVRSHSGARCNPKETHTSLKWWL